MTIWFFSDPHIGHANLVHGYEGKDPGRPEFKSVEHMNETIIENINAVVKPSDHLWCLGDIAMSHDVIEAFMARIDCKHTRLILGNHDVKEAAFYLRFFNKVVAYKEFDGLMFSHMPIAPWSMRWRANVHGHCHLAKPLFYNVTDPELVGFGRKVQYINISMEHTKYRPVTLETLSKWSRQ